MRILKRIKSDNGASNTIELLFILIVLFGILISVVDLGFYFNNRYVISNAVQNNARLVAVFGGTTTKIGSKYGIINNCASVVENGITIDNAVECALYKELKDTTNTVNMQVTRIDCGPNKTHLIGERTYCEVRYKYKGIMGSIFSFMNMESVVRLTAETEVISP